MNNDSLSDKLLEQGISLKRIKIGTYDIDCPKDYCKKARIAGDNDCLHLSIPTVAYAEWRCKHCLFSGHVGELIESAPPPPIISATTFHGLNKVIFNNDYTDLIIVSRATDKAILDDLGLVNVIALPQYDDDDERPRGDSVDRFAYIADGADAFRKAARIIIYFDNDNYGLALRQEVCRRIGPGRCWIATPMSVTIENTLAKDGGDNVCADILECKPLPICGLYEVEDFEKELIAYFEHGMSSGQSTGWGNVDKFYTIAPGQLTVVTGIPNSGKSEWVDALTMNLALNNNWRFAAFSPENGKEIHTTKLVEKRVELSADPKSPNRMNFDTFYSGSQWVRKHYCFIESTQMLPTLDWILERAADAVMRHGIKGLIIDPWNRISKKLEGRQSETDYVGEALPKILQFLQNYGVHGWLIVHPKQQEPDRKTKEIHAPSLYDMAGSANFVNMCDNGIVIHRSNSVDDTTEVHVKKVRFKHIGTRGVTKLSYDIISGRYRPLDAAPTYTFGGEHDGIQTIEPR